MASNGHPHVRASYAAEISRVARKPGPGPPGPGRDPAGEEDLYQQAMGSPGPLQRARPISPGAEDNGGGKEGWVPEGRPAHRQADGANPVQSNLI